MKREGRPHGLTVGEYSWDLRPKPRYLTQLSSPPPNPNLPARLVANPNLPARFLAKPTNHSKFTGKCPRPRCRGCHLNPACKAKDKVKGAQKIRSFDYRVITRRVVDPTPGLKFSGGFSATGILDYLASIDFTDGENDDHLENDGVSGEDETKYIDDYDCYDVSLYNNEIFHEIDDDDDDDDRLSFYEVGFVWQLMDGDDSWYLVDKM